MSRKILFIICLSLSLFGCITNSGSQLTSEKASVVLSKEPINYDPYDKNNLELYDTLEESVYKPSENYGNPIHTTITKDVYCNSIDAKKLSELNLIDPEDITVTKNGMQVYVLSKMPNRRDIEDKVDRSFIYKIKNNKLDIVKINNLPPISCKLSDQIEIDDSSNIYFKLYRRQDL